MSEMVFDLPFGHSQGVSEFPGRLQRAQQHLHQALARSQAFRWLDGHHALS
jgi:hypothetical protein